MTKIKIEDKFAWELMKSNHPNIPADLTYTTATGVTVISNNKGIIAIVTPYGEDWECEGGHFTKHYTSEAEFLKDFAWKMNYPSIPGA